MTTSKSAALFCIALLVPASAHAKIPGATHCYNNICHRVRTLPETETARGTVEVVWASYYDHPDVDRFNPGLMTSSGVEFDADNQTTVASPVWPDGTVLLLRNPDNGQTAIVRVTDGGPYFGDRTLDLTRSLAEALGTSKAGVVQLETMVLQSPTLEETTYKRDRVFAALPGPIGTYASCSAAAAEKWALAHEMTALTHIVVVTSARADTVGTPDVKRTKPKARLRSTAQPDKTADPEPTIARDRSANTSESEAFFAALQQNRVDAMR